MHATQCILHFDKPLKNEFHSLSKYGNFSASQSCLFELTDYNGTVSVTNHGQTCQAWSSQTPHRHIHIKDRLFPMDGSVEEASNYCRDVGSPGRPWCYTTDPDIMWNYCTFRICNGKDYFIFLYGYSADICINNCDCNFPYVYNTDICNTKYDVFSDTYTLTLPI